MNAKLMIGTKPIVRLTLALMLALMLVTSFGGKARAGADFQCTPDGKIVLRLSDESSFRERTFDVYARVRGDSGGTYTRVGTLVANENGSGTSTPFGTPGVTYDVIIVDPLRKEKFDIGWKKCEATGPVGSQGQGINSICSSTGNSVGNNGTLGDPISTSIGEYAFTAPLLDLGGPLPIQLTLFYANSVNKSVGYYNDPFGGDAFSHNLHVGLWLWGADRITVFLGTGLTADFRKSGNGPWQPYKEEIGYQFQETGNRYYLLDPSRELTYTFTKAMLGSERVGFLTRIEDRNGNALTFTNDTAGRVTKVDDGLGRSFTFTYANPAENWTWPHLAQVTDAYNRTVKFGYTTTPAPTLTAHLTSVTDALGATTVFTHTGPLTNTVVSSVAHPRGNVPYTETFERGLLLGGTDGGTNQGWRATSQTDANGNTNKLKFDDKGTTTITDPSGNTMVHAYADGRRLSALTDATGKTATLGYDDAGRRNSITDRLGDTTKFTYHKETGKLASLTNARGETITHTYAPQEQTIGEAKFTFYNLAKVDYPDKTSTQFTYDAKGNVIAAMDRAGQTWKYTYNERGLLLTLANPASGITTYTYNPDMTLASAKDSDTGETKYGYDALKRLVKVTYADNATVQAAYDANDRITSVTDANNRVAKFDYDANGNLVKMTDAVGQISNLSYDALDRLVKATDRLGKSSALTYDALGNVAAVTDATGIATQFGYDPRGWLNQITRSGSTWKIGYDDEGIVTSITPPSGNATKFQSDKLGLLVSATDALGNTSTLTRDSLSRITSATDALKRETKYTYDNYGLLAGITLPDVGSAKYEYDAVGNLAKIVDLNGGEWKFGYTPMGRLQSLTDPLGKVWQYAYDARGRVSQVTYPDGVTRKLTYDAAGNMTNVAYSDGTAFKFGYDALDRLIEANGVKLARDAEGRIVSTDDSAGRLNSATYDDAGRLKTVTYGGVTVTYSYDAKTGLLASVSDSLTKTQYDFTYDKDQQLIGIARSNKVNTALTWDKAGRLTGIKDGSVVDAEYTLDAAGQVAGAKVTAPLDPASAVVGQISNLSYNPASQISSTGYTYDARGRLTQSPTNKFTWDAASHLVGIDPSAGSGQVPTKLTYNGLGDVASRAEGAATIRYEYNYALGLAPIVAETDDASKPLRYYVWTPAGQLLYAIDAADANKVYHYHFDRTGSTLALTDANGAVTDAYAYDPYGKVLGHTGKSVQPFTFVGAWGVRQEGASGALYHMRARYYDATTLRFLSRDPIWPMLTDPLRLNPYQYAMNNPLLNIDPTGLSDESSGASLDNPAFRDFVNQMLSWAGLVGTKSLPVGVGGAAGTGTVFVYDLVEGQATWDEAVWAVVGVVGIWSNPIGWAAGIGGVVDYFIDRWVVSEGGWVEKYYMHKEIEEGQKVLEEREKALESQRWEEKWFFENVAQRQPIEQGLAEARRGLEAARQAEGNKLLDEWWEEQRKAQKEAENFWSLAARAFLGGRASPQKAMPR